MMDEVEATLDAIIAEVETLKPHLLRRNPPAWVVAKYGELLRRSQEARQIFDALEDAEEATQH